MNFMTKIVAEDITDSALLLRDDLSQLEGKNIVITGASGMIGSYLTFILVHANEHFLKKSAHIYVVTRNKHKKFGEQKYIHYVYADITKKLSLPPMDYLIHAASKAAPKLYTDNMIDTLNTNILGMYSLLQLCNQKTKSFLYLSSSEIYGYASDNAVDETFIGTIDHTNRRSCYVEAKRVCETIALNYFWEKKIPVKIARIFHTFGPGVNLSDGRVFSDFLKFGLEHRDIIISGDPTIERSLLYVKDAAIMLLKILLSGRNGEIYNVGSEKNILSVREFADIVCSVFNKLHKDNIHVVVKKNSENTYYKHAVKAIKPSLKKFKQDFNYQPTTTITEAVERTARHFLEEKFYI